MASLEAELSAANASLLEARSLVTDNRQGLQEHKTWMQNLLVKEEVLLGEPPTHCCPFYPCFSFSASGRYSSIWKRWLKSTTYSHA